MAQTDKPTRENRTITVDFHDEVTELSPKIFGHIPPFVQMCYVGGQEPDETSHRVRKRCERRCP
jgi:hypothetical protein